MQGEDTHNKKRTAQGKTPITKNRLRGDFIQRKIKVIDWNGCILEPTYIKRALGLVKNERAVWVTEDTVCMIRQSQEEDIVEDFTTASETVSNDNGSKMGHTEKEALDDGVIMDLAKRRLNAKRNLIGQVIDFALMCSFMLILIESYSWDTRFIVAVTFCAFWGIRLLLRIFKFVKPSFKSGIAAYFRERREQSLESEFNRLRKMSAEQVVGELNR